MHTLAPMFTGIPHTSEVTTLGLAMPGSVVNIELDIVAKHVERLLDPYRP